MNYRISIFLFASIIGFSQSIRAEGQTPIDQVPMYGGMDRAAVPELKAADEKLIADTTSHFGTREKASAAFWRDGDSCTARF